MKGVRFYLDFESPSAKRRGKDEGNVTAVFVCNGTYWGGATLCYEGLGAIYYYPNSPVASTSISLDWLHKCAKRISESTARRIHPLLFTRLDNAN